MAYTYYGHDRTDDPLRGRFTAWLNTTLIHARSKFLKSQHSAADLVYLEEIPAESIEDPCDYFSFVERSPNDFDFEEERLSRAFYELPLMRREVLRLLFVEELSPEEISEKLHCSLNYVYLQKSRAIKKLREALAEGGEDLHDQE